MGYSLKKAEEFLTNKSTEIEEEDILTRIYGKTIPYKRKSVIAGTYIEITKYQGNPYFMNYNVGDFENRDNDSSEVKTNNDTQIVANTQGQDNSTTDRDANIRRSNQRRIHRIKNIIRCNRDIFDKFLTLTLGNKDYSERLNYSINKYPPGEKDHPVPSFYSNIETVLKKLSNVKKIDKCDVDDSHRLNPEDEQLRKEIVNYLGELTTEDTKVKPKTVARRIVEDKYKNETLEPYRFNEQVKLELQRKLDSVICSINPYDNTATKQLIANFVNKMNRLLDENHPNSAGFKYLWVLDFQEDTEKIHFHILCNLPFIKQWKLQKKWGEGIVNIEKIEDISIKNNNIVDKKETRRDGKEKYHQNDHYANIMNYLAKKIRQTSNKINLKNKQLYSISEGLKKPISTINTVELDIITKYLKENHYKAIEIKTVKAKNEYGRSYKKEVYKIDSEALYKARLEVRHLLVKRMVKITKERGLDEITDKIFEKVLLDFDEDLKKEYFPETR